MSEGKNRIMIFGPKDDGTYVVEFRTAAGEALAISIPRTEASVIRHFRSFDLATLRLTLAPRSMRKHFACRQQFTATHQFDVCGLFRRDSKRVRISVSAQHLPVIQLHRRAIK
jgi:hypothetical protein